MLWTNLKNQKYKKNMYMRWDESGFGFTGKVKCVYSRSIIILLCNSIGSCTERETQRSVRTSRLCLPFNSHIRIEWNHGDKTSFTQWERERTHEQLLLIREKAFYSRYLSCVISQSHWARKKQSNSFWILQRRRIWIERIKLTDL